MSARAGRRRFATTRWSLVLAASDQSSADARWAFAALCETYWYPVYDFIRCSGRSADDARDLTQAFFARVLEKDALKTARSERGRFRSFLLASVRHFMSNQDDHDRAAKRGGGELHVPIGTAARDEPQAFVDPAGGDTPETVYERQGHRQIFDTLCTFLTNEDGAYSADCAKTLGLTEGSIRVVLHRMRRRFGQCLRETLAETVDDPAEVDRELEFFLTVVSRGPAATSLKRC